jgi:hypothetical protein
MASIDRAASYNGDVAAKRPQFDEAELEAIIDRLGKEVQATRFQELDGAPRSWPSELPTRRELDRIWAVTAERPYLYRPGAWGRVRGTLLLPLKTLMRRLMRWYVEPLAIDQRAFNAGVLRLADELVDRLASLERSVGSLEERLTRLEGTAEQSPSAGR